MNSKKKQKHIKLNKSVYVNLVFLGFEMGNEHQFT